MKPNFIDKVIGFFSPSAGLRRMQYRLANQRAYDAAKNYSYSDWISANKNGVNAEISAAQAKLQQKSRDLARNNPYAVKALNVIVSNTVGAGIVPNIKGKKGQVKKLTALWKQVAESTLCDPEGRHNFYGLQALAMRTIVESGEAVAMRQVIDEAPQLKLLESDFLNGKKDEGRIVQGIEFDPTGKRVKYHIFKSHPGEKGASDATITLDAHAVAHAYRVERPGQVRGVPWSHAVIEILKDLADFQYATIIGKKVAACFVGLITTNDSDSALSADELKAKRENEMQMNPGTMRYLSQGEEVKFSSPPQSTGYTEFVRESLRAVAAGYGISYEALTGDYSQVNFSSGRMGHIEFRRNLDYWRWGILIPQFCDPYARWFLEWASSKHGIDTTGVTFDWVPPAYSMIDPSKEIEALKREVRAGFKTYGQAVMELGLDPEAVVLEASEWNAKFDELKLSFDSDPRRLSNPGFAHPKDILPMLSDAESLQPDKEEDEEQKEDSEEDASD